MPSTFSQIFPPAPTFTEKDIGNLQGKVFIVTGATSGIGFELAKMLYGHGANVYVAARSMEKIKRAIEDIEAIPASSRGCLIPLVIDLADLRTIKGAVNGFLRREDRLDVLVHNAGLMTPPAGSKSVLGYDLEMATNCLGPFLLNHLLEPILTRTAHAKSAPNAVRIVWLSSAISMTSIVPHGGIHFDEECGSPKVLQNYMQNYMQTKVGNVFLASEAAKRLGRDNVISVSVNPGLIKTELQRHSPKIQSVIMGIVFKPPIFGAYSELFAALSPKITAQHNGAFIVPWGRFGEIPDHIDKGLRPKAEGGLGVAEQFWDWCETETKPYW